MTRSHAFQYNPEISRRSCVTTLVINGVLVALLGGSLVYSLFVGGVDFFTFLYAVGTTAGTWMVFDAIRRMRTGLCVPFEADERGLRYELDGQERQIDYSDLAEVRFCTRAMSAVRMELVHDGKRLAVPAYTDGIDRLLQLVKLGLQDANGPEAKEWERFQRIGEFLSQERRRLPVTMTVTLLGAVLIAAGWLFVLTTGEAGVTAQGLYLGVTTMAFPVVGWLVGSRLSYHAFLRRADENQGALATRSIPWRWWLVGYLICGMAISGGGVLMIGTVTG